MMFYFDTKVIAALLEQNPFVRGTTNKRLDVEGGIAAQNKI